MKQILLHTSIVCFFIFFLNVGCGKKSTQNEHQLNTVQYLSIDSVKNALMHTEDFGEIKLVESHCVIDEPDSLANDTYQVTFDLLDNFTSADLNKDGYADVIGSMAYNAGGTGTFVSMEIFLNQQGSARHTASYLIGDRIKPDSIIVRIDTINLYFKDRLPDEPMSGPGSIVTHKMLKLLDNGIIELN